MVINLVVPTVGGLLVLTLSYREQEDEMAKFLGDHSRLFEEAHGLLLSEAMEHEIKLISDVPLPNLGMYTNFVIKNEKIK